MLQTGVGCASAMVLLPDELRRVFGEGAQLLIAPMRDVLISLPPDVDRAFAAWLNDEFASMDPNGTTHYIVRNPWGVSGDALENSSGYATLTYAQMAANFIQGTLAV